MAALWFAQRYAIKSRYHNREGGSSLPVFMFSLEIFLVFHYNEPISRGSSQQRPGKICGLPFPENGRNRCSAHSGF